MKKIIAALIAGIVLGTAGVGIAATSGYWTGNGVGYRCEGTSSGAICDQTGYTTLVKGNSITIFKGEDPIFTCNRGRSIKACSDYRVLYK
jgi:hypothetical protein